MKYKRVLLKLSGEALMGDQKYGIDPQRLDQYALEILETNEEALLETLKELEHKIRKQVTDTFSAIFA